jgi:hypothetical protein
MMPDLYMQFIFSNIADSQFFHCNPKFVNNWTQALRISQDSKMNISFTTLMRFIASKSSCVRRWNKCLKYTNWEPSSG